LLVGTSLISASSSQGAALISNLSLLITLFLLLAVLALVLGGPYLYRRYYETFGNKSINATSSPKATAKLSEIWEETIGGATKKLSELSGKLGSSFLSESKIEIAPIKSEDRIRMSDPVE